MMKSKAGRALLPFPSHSLSLSLTGSGRSVTNASSCATVGSGPRAATPSATGRNGGSGAAPPPPPPPPPSPPPPPPRGLSDTSPAS